MTARNYVGNGFFWTGSDYYRGSYLTAYRNGDYGIYAFDAYHGQFDHSYGGGSPDAGFYIGECFRCDAVIDTSSPRTTASATRARTPVATCTSSTRCSGTTARASCPTPASYELCYPSARRRSSATSSTTTTTSSAPAIAVALLAQGNGILVRRRRSQHDRAQPGVGPRPHRHRAGAVPRGGRERPRAARRASGTRRARKPANEPVPEIPAADCKAVEGLLAGCAVLWHPYENRVVGNVVETSGVADLAVATADLFGTGETTDTLGNCFSDNTFTTSAPTDLETLAPCDGTGSGDWNAGALDLLGLSRPARGRSHPTDTYQTTPEPPEQENMPDARTKPAERFEGPEYARHRRDRGSRQTCRLSARDAVGSLRSRSLIVVVVVVAVARRVDTRVSDAPSRGRSRVGPGAPRRAAGPCRPVRGEVCSTATRRRDDPIVHFGHPGRSHRHDFYGAVAADAIVDRRRARPRRTRRATSGPTPRRTGTRRCTTGTRSSSRTPSSRTTAPRPASTPADVEMFPSGLAMIAGDAAATRASARRGRRLDMRRVDTVVVDASRLSGARAAAHGVDVPRLLGRPSASTATTTVSHVAYSATGELSDEPPGARTATHDVDRLPDLGNGPRPVGSRQVRCTRPTATS